jgi:hypothetical protein
VSQLVGEQAAQRLAQRGGFGVAGVVSADAAAQALSAGRSAIGRRLAWADAGVEQRVPGVLAAARRVDRSGQHVEPPAMNTCRRRDRARTRSTSPRLYSRAGDRNARACASRSSPTAAQSRALFSHAFARNPCITTGGKAAQVSDEDSLCPVRDRDSAALRWGIWCCARYSSTARNG